METVVAEYQCGFKKERSTIDQLQIATNIRRKVWTWNSEMGNIYREAYDRMKESELYKTL